MTDGASPNKKRRRRRGGRRHRKGGNQGQQPQQQKANANANGNRIEGGQAHSTRRADLPDNWEEREATRSVKQDPAIALDAAVNLLVEETLQARHMEVFEWLCRSLGKTPSRLVSEILRAAVVKEAAAYREAMGGGGASSKDGAALAERIPVKR